jgi:WD40 repeat protein
MKSARLLPVALLLPLTAVADSPPAVLVARLGSTRLRPLAPARAVAFSPDGKTLAAAGEGGLVQAWDVASGQTRWHSGWLRETTGGGPWGPAVTFTPDGKSVVVPGESAFLFLDTDSGSEQRSVGPPENATPFRALGLSPDGKLLCTLESGKIVFRGIEDGREMFRVTDTGAGPAALRLDARRLLLYEPPSGVTGVDLAAGKQTNILAARAFGGRTNGGSATVLLAGSADGQRAALSVGAGAVTLFSVPDGKVVRRIDPGKGGARALALTSDGSCLAVADGSGVRFCSAASGALPRRLDHDAAPFSSLAFSRDGRFLAATSSGGSVHLWDVTSKRELHPPEGHTAGVQAIVWLDAGKRLASWDAGGRVILWDPGTGRPVEGCRGLDVRPASLAATPDGQGIQGVTQGGTFRRWRPGSSVQSRGLDLPSGFGPPLAIDHDGRQAAGRGAGLALRLWGPDGERSLPPAAAPSDHLVFSPDGTRLAGVAAGRPVVWGCTDRKLLLGDPASAVRANPAYLPLRQAIWTPDGRALLLRLFREIRAVEVVSGAARPGVPPAPQEITALGVSPDGRRLACARDGGAVEVLDAHSGRRLCRFDGGPGRVDCLAFAPDGRLLAGAGPGGLVLVWKLPSPPRQELTRGRRVALWSALGAGDADAAARAMAVLADSPQSCMDLVRERLGDLTDRNDPRRLARLIAALDAEDFEARERAQKDLAAAGAEAAAGLREALQTTRSEEVRRRVRELLQRIPEGEVPPGWLRGVRAVEVLECLGSPEARGLLQELARKAGEPRVAQEARDSLSRLGAGK